MDKLGRNYNLQVQGVDGEFYGFAPPYTIDFNIQRSVMAEANCANIKIYNLAANTRNQLRKDSTDWGLNRRLILKAGYGNNLSVVIDGQITLCSSVRQGVNFITEIEVQDAGFVFNNAEIKYDFTAGTSYQQIIEGMIKQLKPFGVEIGAIGEIPGQVERGGSYSGNIMEKLRELTGYNFYIDNGKAYVLKDDEAYEGGFQEISSETGLLNTPVLENTYVNCELLFEPRIVMGQLINLKTTTGSNNNNINPSNNIIGNFDGLYKVFSISHSALISPTVCGDAITKVGLGGALSIGVVKGVF